MSNYQILYVPLHDNPSVHAEGFHDKNLILTTKGQLAYSLELNLQEQFDLILIDCLSASTEVETACIELRGKFEKPILVWITDGDEGCLSKLYELGIDECIVRPTGIDLMAAKIRSWLRWSLTLSPDSTKSLHLAQTRKDRE